MRPTTVRRTVTRGLLAATGVLLAAGTLSCSGPSAASDPADSVTVTRAGDPTSGDVEGALDPGRASAGTDQELADPCTLLTADDLSSILGSPAPAFDRKESDRVAVTCAVTADAFNEVGIREPRSKVLSATLRVERAVTSPSAFAAAMAGYNAQELPGLGRPAYRVASSVLLLHDGHQYSLNMLVTTAGVVDDKPIVEAAKIAIARLEDRNAVTADTKQVCAAVDGLAEGPQMARFAKELTRLIGHKEAKEPAQATQARERAKRELKALAGAVRAETSTARDPKLKAIGEKSARSIEKSAADNAFFATLTTLESLEPNLRSGMEPWLSRLGRYCA